MYAIVHLSGAKIGKYELAKLMVIAINTDPYNIRFLKYLCKLDCNSRFKFKNAIFWKVNVTL